MSTPIYITQLSIRFEMRAAQRRVVSKIEFWSLVEELLHRLRSWTFGNDLYTVRA